MTYWISMAFLVAALLVPSPAWSAILGVTFFVVLICRPAIDRVARKGRHRV